MYDQILIPTDGSQGITEVLPHALDLARNHDARVHTLYVVDRRQYIAAPDEIKEQIRETLKTDGKNAVSRIESDVESAGLRVVSRVQTGIPHREILKYISENEIDLVVLGTHGRTGRDRLVHLGSVTERVLKNASIPSFIVSVSNESSADEE